MGGGPVGTGTEGGAPEEETLASAEPELEAVMAEEFSTSIGMARNRLKATFFLSFFLFLLYFPSFFPIPIPN